MRSWIVACATLALIIAACALGTVHGYPAARITIQARDAWVTTDPTGNLTLIDGANAAVVGDVHVAPEGDLLTAVQDGSGAYAADQDTRRLSKVDAATMAVSARTSPVPGRGTLQVLAGRQGIFAAGGKIQSFTPADLRPGDVPLPGVAPAGTVVLDQEGSLWALSGTGGRGHLMRLTPGKTGQWARQTRIAATSPGDLLITAAGSVVLVNPAAQTADLFSPQTGAETRTMPLPGATGSAQVSGSSPNPGIYLVVPSAHRDKATITVCLFSTRSCERPLDIGSGGPGCPARSPVAGKPFGPVVAAGRFRYVPDYISGTVYVLPDNGGQPARVRALGPCHLFDLFSRDGVVFLNDPAGPNAGIVGPGARIRVIEKYRPRQLVAASTGPPNERASIPPLTPTPPASEPPSPGPGSSVAPPPTPVITPAPTPSATFSPVPTPTKSPVPVRRRGTLVMTAGGAVYDLDSLAPDWNPFQWPNWGAGNIVFAPSMPELDFAGYPENDFLLPPGSQPWNAKTCEQAPYSPNGEVAAGHLLYVGLGICLETVNTPQKTDGCHLVLLVVKALTSQSITLKVTVWNIRPPGPYSGGQC